MLTGPARYLVRGCRYAVPVLYRVKEENDFLVFLLGVSVKRLITSNILPYMYVCVVGWCVLYTYADGDMAHGTYTKKGGVKYVCYVATCQCTSVATQ